MNSHISHKICNRKEQGILEEILKSLDVEFFTD